jgi:predicted AAA+ superfamily ATPase
MYTRLLERPLQVESSFFLFGPRGTGKTTWLKKNFPRAIYLDLLDSALYTDLLAHPERLRTLVPKGGAHAVIIDEVQRVPELLNEVHRLIESEGTRFILTGSSARALRRRGVNLLAGRALTFHMHPLTCAELGSDFSLHGSLLHGNLPLAHSAPDPQLFLKSYVQSYLREEVLQEGLTRNIGAFSRFLEAASFSQASILNVSETARECAVERKTVSGYFQVLEDLLLSVTVPVFSRKAKRRLVSHTKFYYFDTGVYRALRPAGPLDRREEIEGVCLETLVFQELRALNDYLDLGYRIHFWRTSSGAEVDFVLYGERGIVALEVKRTRRATRSDVSGLSLFKADYPSARCVLLFGGERREYRDGIELIPFEEGFKALGNLLGEPDSSPTSRVPSS